ncbi:sodium-dependent transporter [Parasphingorhabdus pacifica]
MSTEKFGSRLAFLAASIGMAVGAGNIWRFPRVAAEWGGGTFLIVCVIVMLVWSVPLLMAESLMGSHSQLGTIGAFRDFVGRKFAWMGAFMALVTVGIAFYYAVVCGWSLRYFTRSLTGSFGNANVDTQAVWSSFTSSPPQTILFHLLAVLLVGALVFRGVKGGFETVLKIALPALFVIMAILAIRAMALPGAGEGLRHLFAIEWSDFGNVRIWLEAFTQVAFSTGAGFGLYLTYSVYTRHREKATSNAFIVVGGNFLVSILAAIAVLVPLFALGSAGFAQQAVEGSNEGLVFIYVAQLFAKMPGGAIFAALFFLALTLATLSTLVAFVELAVRNVVDMGLRRHYAVVAVTGVIFLGGIPSAINLDFLSNQDFVWGIGLLLTGFLVSIAMRSYGIARARAKLTETGRVATAVWWAWSIRAVPVLFAVLLGWWIYQSIFQFAPDSWWNPFETSSLATLLMQWALALCVVLALNSFLVRKVAAGPMSIPGGRGAGSMTPKEPEINH